MPLPPNYGLAPLADLALPLPLDALKRHVRLQDDDTQDDELLAKALYAAEDIEEMTGRVALARQYLLTLPYWPGADLLRGYANAAVEFPRFPLVSVDSVQYVDTNGVTQSFGGYQVSTNREPGVMRPARFTFYPLTDPQTVDAVRITFTAGYTVVPNKYLEAVKFAAAYRFFNRESDADGTYPESLQRLYRRLGCGNA